MRDDGDIITPGNALWWTVTQQKSGATDLDRAGRFLEVIDKMHLADTITAGDVIPQGRTVSPAPVSECLEWCKQGFYT